MKYPSIDKDNYPLGFLFIKGGEQPDIVQGKTGTTTYTTHARQMALFQKEALIQEGDKGNRWRLSSDEGKHLSGTDLAPFPLGFFNAALHGDLTGRIRQFAKRDDIIIDKIDMEVSNFYYMTGSFVKGDAAGHAEPPLIEISITADISAEKINTIISDALTASPFIYGYRNELHSRFSLFINGTQKTLSNLPNCPIDAAEDPFMIYQTTPAPVSDTEFMDGIIRKTGEELKGEITKAPTGTTTKIIRNIYGESHSTGDASTVIADTVLGLPGMTRFEIGSDEGGNSAPSGLSHMCAGVSFCFLTQLHRYIEHQKFSISGMRLTQTVDFEVSEENGAQIGKMAAVDTHLYMNGDASEEAYERLLELSARSCYLHATLAKPLEPKVEISLNGNAIS